MDDRRLKKLEDAFLHALAKAFQFEARNPQLNGIRVTRVKITPDLSLATIYFELPEGSMRAQAVLKALMQSKGFLKQILASEVEIRRMPDLNFFYDETSDLAERVDKIFEQLEKEKK